MDPSPLRLRDLVVMADGRRKAEWDRTGAVVIWLASQAGVKLDPATINPYRKPVPPPPKTPEQRERENRAGWKLLNRVMGARNGSRRK